MTIRINGITWYIIFTDNPYYLKYYDGSIRLGITDTIKKTIYILDGLSGEILRKVLLHELTHAWIASYDIDLHLQSEEFLCSFIDSFSDDIISQCDYILQSPKWIK